MDNKKIGQFISELRKEQGLNQKELAERLSVTDKAVSKWETGRGIPDVSILQPLAEIFDVTVSEILNGERMPQQVNNDEQLIKKLKTKRYIRLAVELIITAVFGWGIYMFHNSFEMYKNVLDMYLHRNEIEFLSVCTLIYLAVGVVWVLTVVLTAVFRKRAAVLKTIIICLTASFVIGCSVHIAVLEDNRPLQLYDTPIDTVSYIKYDDFFSGAFDTQISIKDTNDKITENYIVQFDGKGDSLRFAYTTCVAADEYSIIKAYYEEQRALHTDNENYADLDRALLERLGASDGFCVTKLYSENDVALCIVKGTSCYTINLSDADLSNEKLLTKIAEL